MDPQIATVGIPVATGVRITFHPAIRASSNSLMEEIGVEGHQEDLLVSPQQAWDLRWPKDKGHLDITLRRRGLRILSSTK
jgi:hypothetical protein